MLQMNDTNLNFNAISHDNTGEQFASLSASYGGGESVYFSVTLNAMEADNIAAVKDDFDSFIDKVVATIVKSKV